jgi:hypothetical protein
MPRPAEDKQKRLKEHCKKIADFFQASASNMFEGQNGLIFNLEFDDAKKFEEFAEYLRAQGLLLVDSNQTKSGEVH